MILTKNFALCPFKRLLPVDILIDVRQGVGLNNASCGQKTLWIKFNGRLEAINFTEATKSICKVADSRTTACVCNNATILNTTLDDLVIHQRIINHAGVFVGVNLHFDTIVVSLIILWRNMLHIVFELLTDEMIIDFEFFFRCFIRVDGGELTVGFKDFALIVLKIANQVCVLHCFFDFICGDNTLFRKALTNSVVVWVIHIPTIFVIIMCAAGSKKLVTLNCLLGIYVVTVKADNHLNAVLFRKLQNANIQLFLLVCVMGLDFKHEVILEIVM